MNKLQRDILFFDKENKKERGTSVLKLLQRHIAYY
ncbi:hypothetical protein BACCIP111895_01956 [Neobacillus rhizosphaerae]|uniref:Uncharacterized protein n=1 Tax=Neobacillus rhizosphaerae TaxID=2880965 RepID=A0ABN8KPY8_9BACI|nr:hypothetical protein BACCIP111895_01956 [Neobacillus rhizosphaerae]